MKSCTEGGRAQTHTQSHTHTCSCKNTETLHWDRDALAVVSRVWRGNTEAAMFPRKTQKGAKRWAERGPDMSAGSDARRAPQTPPLSVKVCARGIRMREQTGGDAIKGQKKKGYCFTATCKEFIAAKGRWGSISCFFCSDGSNFVTRPVNKRIIAGDYLGRSSGRS